MFCHVNNSIVKGQMKGLVMEEEIRMNGDWYIPETNETIAGTL